MQRARLSAATAAAVMAAGLLAACSSKPVDKTAGWSPNRIQAEAKDEMKSGSYDKAIPLFETLEGRAAGTPLAQQAELDKAYAQFKDGQKAAKQAFESFDELVKRFPDSRYTPDARARMRYTVNALAQYEVHVARYYYQRGAYVAAINRAQQAIADYRDAPALEEALYILTRAYDKLGMDQLRDDAERVLTENYPNSVYMARGFKGPDKPWWQLW